MPQLYLVSAALLSGAAFGAMVLTVSPARVTGALRGDKLAAIAEPPAAANPVRVIPIYRRVEPLPPFQPAETGPRDMPRSDAQPPADAPAAPRPHTAHVASGDVCSRHGGRRVDYRHGHRLMWRCAYRQ